MPKQALAGATQMVGAMDGATAVMTAPPPTRVDASAASVPEKTVAPVAARSRMPMYAGGGAAAVGLALLATLSGANSVDKSGGTLKAESTQGGPARTVPR